MKKTASFTLLLLISTLCFAQIKNPVKWSYTAKKINATTYEVVMTAAIENGWHLYSQNTPAGGPLPTAITFVKNPLLALGGKPKEVGKPEQHHEELFGVDVKQFSKTAAFVQTVTLKGKAKTSLAGSIGYMSCNNHECLPPRTEKFSIGLN